ncbi:DUF6272 family protein [Myxococcota bacterium]|nr:DUF6272 family protein [Myxococcota bacterium]
MDLLGQVGDTLTPQDPADRLSNLRIELLPIDLIVQWRRCSKMADFLASYFEYHFESRVVAAQVLSTGLNELIENLAKFSADKQRPVSVEISHFGEVITFETQNEARRAEVAALRARLTRMATTDPEELFLEQLEHTASRDRAASGLGLINLKKDYGARLSAEIRAVPDDPERFHVTLQLALEVDAVERG